jgi:hypothetical protein
MYLKIFLTQQLVANRKLNKQICLAGNLKNAHPLTYFSRIRKWEGSFLQM